MTGNTGADAAFGHVPVLRDRVIALLAPAVASPGAVVVDATLGLGGHSAALLDAMPQLRVLGIDRDQTAIQRARARLSSYDDRVTFAHATFDEIPSVLAAEGIEHVDGVLFDLGVSSIQLDETERGFSYAQDAPLDMRMDTSAPRTAADVLNEYDARDLARILREYGEERFARRIADRVVTARATKPLTSTAELVDIVRAAIPAPARRRGGHPAKRTFQALRIEVNGELDVLRRAIPVAIEALRSGGRIVVLSYHSLEDRIVKRALAALARPDHPHGLPTPPPPPALRLLTRGAEQADDVETARNPRAASVRLRAAERLEVAA